MPEEKFKRNVAFKLRIGEIVNAQINSDKLSSINFGDKKISRVNLIGSIVDKYESDGERKFLFLTLDDGSGQIKLKVFGDEIEKFRNILQGQIVLVIGVLRYFNNEIYISPEIIREEDSRYLIVRKLETEKKQIPLLNKEQKIGLRESIIELIKNSENVGGIDSINLVANLKENSPESINIEVQKLLEEGIIFEPRPGRIRWLG